MEANTSGLQEPGTGGWFRVSKDRTAKAVEDVAWAKTSYHPKEGELSDVEEAREGEITTKKVNNRFALWSF